MTKCKTTTHLPLTGLKEGKLSRDLHADGTIELTYNWKLRVLN
jgi:hypothetical protein